MRPQAELVESAIAGCHMEQPMPIQRQSERAGELIYDARGGSWRTIFGFGPRRHSNPEQKKKEERQADSEKQPQPAE